MTETKRRIQELTKALPYMREKVAAVAVLFALSLTLMISVSYAWYTLSMKPELGGVNTTVSANGNLEIALSDLDGKEPEPSGVDDSFGANGQTVHGANTTWGNLINISNGYGLESLVLRPAKFDAQSMTYLSSALYGSDGRVEDMTSNFSFTTWKYNDALKQYEFAVPVEDGELYDAYGVRAISTVTLSDVGSAMEAQLVAPGETCDAAAAEYLKIMQNQQYMSAIRQVVQIYLNYNMYEILNRNNLGWMASGRDDSEITSYMPALQALYSDFYNKAILKFGDALTELANIQLTLNGYTTDPTKATINGATNPNYRKKYGTDNPLVGYTANQLAQNGINLGTSFTKYQTLEKTIKADMEALNKHCETYTEGIYLDPDQHTEVYKSAAGSSTLLDIVNNLININSALVDGTAVSKLLGSGSTAMSYINGLNNGDTVEVVVTKGAIWDFEALTDAHMDVTLSNLDMILKTVHGHMSTNAQGRVFSNAISLTQNMDASFAAGMIADNTYGMVLDLWFRTNSGSEEDNNQTLLTLDGLPELEITYERRMFLPSGETEAVPVSVFMRDTDAVIGGIRLQEEVLVYKKPFDLNNDGTIGDGTDMDGDGTIEDAEKEEYIYVNCVTYEPAYKTKLVDKTDENDNVQQEVVDTNEYITDADVTDKMDKIETVIGFTSSNRIWKEGELVMDTTEISSSQGSGSCYVFYADTPAQADSAMELLRHMKLAFVDETGTMTSQAIMDVDHVFAEGGKYTVPILVTGSTSSIVNEGGEEVLGVAPLTKNVAKRISVIVYLEGEDLENSMVMSKDDIVGSLNLQFSTVDDLRSMKDTALAMDTISLRAEIQDGSAMADGKGQIVSVTFDGSTVSKQLTAYVEGLTPAKVEAVFMRQINATQGRQMDPIVLTNTSGSVYVGSTAFTKPGTYVLSRLRLDGIEYALPEEYHITVDIDGYTVKSVAFCETPGDDLELTTDSSVQRDVTVEFDASLAAQPTTVEAYFTTENGLPVSTKLRRGSDGYWTGTANFTASGTYKLQYLILDGEYVELEKDGATNDWKTLTAYLGLRAQVTLEHYVEDANGAQVNSLNIVYDNTAEEKETVIIRADILTDTGDKLSGFNNVVLRYGKRGSNTLEDGLFAKLKWENQQYCGEFLIDKVGVFNFAQLEIGTENTLTSATYADSITARSINPVKFEGSDTAKLQVVKGDTATYTAKLLNAEAMTGGAVVISNPEYENGKDIPVTINDLKSFTITFPSTPANGQNGVWTVKELRVAGVYDEAGLYYDGNVETGDKTSDAYAAYYTLPVTELTEGDQIATVAEDENGTGENTTGDTSTTEEKVGVDYVVVNKIEISDLPKAETAVLSKKLVTGTNGAVTTEDAVFLDYMQLNQLDNFGVTISFPGFSTDSVKSEKLYDLIGADAVKMKLIHNKDTSHTNGGYTYEYPSKNADGNDFSNSDIALFESSSEITLHTKVVDNVEDPARRIITSENKETVYLAGTYDYSLSVKVNGVEFTFNSTAGAGTDDVLKVKSEKAKLSIAGVTPEGTFDVRANDTTYRGISNCVSEDGSSAFVYMSATYNDYGLYGTWSYGKPSVMLKLTNVSNNFTTAEVTYGNEAKTDNITTVEFTPNVLEVASVVGYVEEVWGVSDTPYCAGEQTISQMTATAGKCTFNVDLANTVTIKQTEIPTCVDFSVNDPLYSGSVPSLVQPTDGEHVVLPKIENWVVNKEIVLNPTVSTTTDNQSKVYTVCAHGENGHAANVFGASVPYTAYNTYTRHEYVHTEEGTTVNYDITYKLSWLIDGVKYDSGETISVDGAKHATAVIEEVSRTELSRTTKKIQITETHDVQTGTCVSSKRNHTEVSTLYLTRTETNRKEVN